MRQFLNNGTIGVSTDSEQILKTGTLWSRIVCRTERALNKGALMPISTQSSLVRDGGIEFLVRIVSSLIHKSEGKERGTHHPPGVNRRKPNPFLPYEQDMFVSSVSPTHLCLLNKYNVIDHHLLIVTRHYEDQETLLNQSDFEAIWMCMAEFDGLAFYNGGRVAGASQPHKHLQMIPLPMADGPFKVPVSPLIGRSQSDGSLWFSADLPFVHAIAQLDPAMFVDAKKAANTSFHLYRLMLEKVGLNRYSLSPVEQQSGPYNLLLTREWMLLVKRRTELYGSISINALGFAGALLVRNHREMQSLKDRGPLSVLQHTAFPCSTADQL